MTANTHNPPTLDQVRAKLWQTNQTLYQAVADDAERIGFLLGTLQGVRICLSEHSPNIADIVSKIEEALKIDAARKEKPNAN